MGVLVFLVALGILVALAGFIYDSLGNRPEAEKKLSELESKFNDFLVFKSEYEQKINRKIQDLRDASSEIQRDRRKLESEWKLLNKYEKDLNELVRQRSKGFPLLGDVYAEYIKYKNSILSDDLRNKKRPALKAAEAIKESNAEKRKLAKELKVLQLKLKNYELIAPFLTDSSEEDEVLEEDFWVFQDYTEEELADETTRFLSKDEYRKLSTPERNQLALDRYWQKRKKSKWAIGKMYELYIGFLYEYDGWEVEYFGITRRKEDYGRDLIATKGHETHIVQCKHWSKYKTIYENHIFQTFGTAYEYQKTHPKEKVSAVFYTSTTLSETAKEFSKRLGIKLFENKKLDQYPAIKCNVTSTKEKIYHLPFDQQYDKTKIEPKKGEFYCMTVAEAEDKGFRRAKKWIPQS